MGVLFKYFECYLSFLWVRYVCNKTGNEKVLKTFRNVNVCFIQHFLSSDFLKISCVIFKKFCSRKFDMMVSCRIFWSNSFFEEFWMAISWVSGVNKVSEVTVFEVSEFMRCIVTEMQSFSGVTTKIYSR